MKSSGKNAEAAELLRPGSSLAGKDRAKKEKRENTG